MSEENVKATRDAVEAFNVGMDEFMATHTGDVELVPDPMWPEQGPFRGRDEVRRWWEQILEQYESHENVLDDVASVDEHRVLMNGRWHVRGQGSGVTTTLTYSAVLTLREGLVCRFQFFFDRQKALEAAGLSE